MTNNLMWLTHKGTGHKVLLARWLPVLGWQTSVSEAFLQRALDSANDKSEEWEIEYSREQ